MGFLQLFLIAVGLSMDAFAVSMCKGLGMRAFNRKNAAVVALFFGGFQALMPVVGWLLGRSFESYITAYDHWIAFALLGVIGTKMIVEAIRDDGGCEECASGSLDYKELLVLSVATSIDALAVGITFAFLQVSILPAASLIGVTTFALSFIGAAVGCRFGAAYKNKAQILGGAVLILIGVKILIEHLSAG